MPSTLLVHRPDADDPPVAPGELAPRRPIDGGARLLLVDNGKAKAKDVLNHLAEELKERMPIASVETISKPGAGYPLEDEQIAELAERADIVIAGLGDCGACSACSLHDALLFERAGVPATVLITEVFVGNVARFSESLGFPGYHSLVIPHPAATKSDDQLRHFAASVADAASTQLGAVAVYAVT
jgi:hypothetical protein